MDSTRAYWADVLRVGLTLVVPPVVVGIGASAFLAANGSGLPPLPVFGGVVLLMVALLAAAAAVIPRIGGQQ